MSDIRNPKAVLTPIGAAPSTDSMHGTTRTVSKPTLASDKPGGSIIEQDLAAIRALGPGPMPWETSSRDPVARFKEQDVP